MNNDSLPALSLFSGVGGLDLGIRAAGFDVGACVEFEENAASSLRANNLASSQESVMEASIVETPTEAMLERVGVRAGELALVFGGPPCTPFSKSGYWLEYKRRGLDPDASLLDEFVRVVREARPEAALLENVHGLAYGNHNRLALRRLIGGLEREGYSTAHRVLNAADYGVPQLRKRLFLYATRGTTPEFPSPTHSGWTETRRRYDDRLLPYITAGETIADLTDEENPFEPEEVVGGKHASLLPMVPPGDNYLYFTAHRGHANPLFKWRSRYWTFLLKLDPSRPATTIQSQPGPSVGPFHWQNRRLRITEVKRLQTFPDDYIVVGTRRSAQVQLGNAVPPQLAQIVAAQLSRSILGHPVDAADQQLRLQTSATV